MSNYGGPAKQPRWTTVHETLVVLASKLCRTIWCKSVDDTITYYMKIIILGWQGGGDYVASFQVLDQFQLSLALILPRLTPTEALKSQRGGRASVDLESTSP